MTHRLIAYSLILLGIGGTIYIGFKGIYGDRYNTPSMSIETFSRQIADSSNYILIDVRTESEIAAQPALWDSTIHIPLMALEERYMELTEFKDRPLMMLCPSGNRSRQGARLLRLAGFKAYYLNKGMFGAGE